MHPQQATNRAPRPRSQSRRRLAGLACVGLGGALWWAWLMPSAVWRRVVRRAYDPDRMTPPHWSLPTRCESV